MDYQKGIRKDKKLVFLNEFSNEVLVCCPSCKSQAKVSYDKSSPNIKLNFHCSNCFKQLEDDSWYGPVILSPKSKKCDFCGFTISDLHQKGFERDMIIKVSCKNCGKKKPYDAEHWRIVSDLRNPRDPHFGLQLWLQSGFDGSVLWAYNTAHLDFLEEYISSKLREEKVVSPRALSQTMPSFIMKASNRAKLLKLISKMRKTIN